MSAKAEFSNIAATFADFATIFAYFESLAAGFSRHFTLIKGRTSGDTATNQP